MPLTLPLLAHSLPSCKCSALCSNKCGVCREDRDRLMKEKQAAAAQKQKEVTALKAKNNKLMTDLENAKVTLASEKQKATEAASELGEYEGQL